MELVRDVCSLVGETIPTGTWLNILSQPLQLFGTMTLCLPCTLHLYQVLISQVEKTSPHPMMVGDDDILYIGSGNYVHAYDGATGANGTFIQRFSLSPAGFVVKSFAKIENYQSFSLYYNNTNSSYLGQSKAYFGIILI